MSGGYLRNIKFLVVEDDAFMRKIVRNVLGVLGVGEVQDAKDGSQALKVLKAYAPDIIITDWKMGPMDGIEFTKTIRTADDSFNPFVPIIMLSSHSEISKIIEARDAGINEFVVKPISVNALFSRIQTVIDRPRSFVRLDDYFGPDRRRRNKPNEGADRRTTLPGHVGSGEASLSQDQINEAMAAPDDD